MAAPRSTVVRQAAGGLPASSSYSPVLCAVPRTPAPTFKITRQPPLIVAPDRPTPRQSLYLSNIDDQAGLRYQIPWVLFYCSDSSKKKNEQDPVKVVKEALAKVLVHFYPLAGRLRDADNGNSRWTALAKVFFSLKRMPIFPWKTLEISIHLFLVEMTLSIMFRDRKTSQTAHYF